MKPLNRDFWWMLLWLVFALLQLVNLFLKTVQTNEQRFSRVIIICWIGIAAGMAISRFGRWRKDARKMAEDTAENK